MRVIIRKEPAITIAAFQDPDRKLVLGSGSSIRKTLLENAGLVFETDPARIDEDAIKDAIMADPMPPEDVAVILAEAKAGDVSPRHPGAMVIGCDQTLGFEGATLSKAPDIESLRQQLLDMRGKRHQLHASVVLMRDSETVWRHVETATLDMRDISPAFLGRYLSHAGESALQSVGGYQLERLGIQLFETVDADYFTILGLPMVPLLAALRAKGWLLA